MQILLLLSFILNATAQQETFTVTYHRGNIRLLPQHELIHDGQVLSANDRLVMDAPADFISLFNEKLGRIPYHADQKMVGKALTPEDLAKAVGRVHGAELLTVLHKEVIPSTSQHAMTVRAPLINSVMSFQNYLTSLELSGSNPLVLLDSLHIRLNPQYFSDRSANFFFIQYRYQKDTIAKKLHFRGPSKGGAPLTLIIDTAIYRVDGRKIDPASTSEMELIYRKTGTGEQAPVGRLWLKPYPRNMAIDLLRRLKAELKTSYQDQPDRVKKLNAALYDELTEDLGRLDKESFETLLIQI